MKTIQMQAMLKKLNIFAAGVDRMGIVRDVLGRKTLQVLAAQQVAMEHLHAVGVEMHIMTHLVERYLHRFWVLHGQHIARYA